MADAKLDAQNATLRDAVAARLAEKEPRGESLGDIWGSKPKQTEGGFKVDGMADTFTGDTREFLERIERAAEAIEKATRVILLRQSGMTVPRRVYEQVVAERDALINQGACQGGEIRDEALRQAGTVQPFILDASCGAGISNPDEKDPYVKSVMDAIQKRMDANGGGTGLSQEEAAVVDAVRARDKRAAAMAEWDKIQHSSTLQPMELRTQPQTPRFIRINSGENAGMWLNVEHIQSFYTSKKDGRTAIDYAQRTGRGEWEITVFPITESVEAFAARLNGEPETQGDAGAVE